jgi:hypothetical protein
MSNSHISWFAAFVLALVAGALPAEAGDENGRVAEAARFAPAPPVQNLVILKTRVVQTDTSPAFRSDETLHTSKLTTGELFRQLLVDMPLAQRPLQASTPRPATDGRAR